MSEKKEEKIIERTATTDGVIKETRVEERRRITSHLSNKTVVGVVAIVAFMGIAIFIWWMQTRNSGAGRPVPVPRTITVDPPGANNGTQQAATEATLTLTPEQVQITGLKIETVGEQMSSEIQGQAATGVVQSNAYRETPVVSLVGGILRSVGAELGQSIKKGQTVAVVSSNELSDIQSRYITAVAELDEHHKHHQRSIKLVAIGAESREELEQAATKLRTAESEVASLKQKLLILGLNPQRVNALRSSSQISSEVSLPSPASGTVTARTANPGEVIEANKEILRVTDLSSVWVVAQVYEKDLAKVRVGSGASITSDAYPGKLFRGRVSYVAPSLDPATRTAQVRIELANPGQVLKLGMYVNVAFATITGSESTTPVVPVAAVQNINNQQVVFVATTDPNVFAMRPVRLGAESNGYFPVMEGLTVGERIVTEGSFMLRAEWLKMHPAQ
ncbi:MAG: efflux RND transporter periplasmic adaptor subunit [Acidobacteria bacterium]|nr:efflux RND transporter periplasmic adaptor subunit [Acidobacteriota bacterium]